MGMSLEAGDWAKLSPGPRLLTSSKAFSYLVPSSVQGPLRRQCLALGSAGSQQLQKQNGASQTQLSTLEDGRAQTQPQPEVPLRNAAMGEFPVPNSVSLITKGICFLWGHILVLEGDPGMTWGVDLLKFGTLWRSHSNLQRSFLTSPKLIKVRLGHLGWKSQPGESGGRRSRKASWPGCIYKLSSSYSGGPSHRPRDSALRVEIQIGFLFSQLPRGGATERSSLTVDTPVFSMFVGLLFIAGSRPCLGCPSVPHRAPASHLFFFSGVCLLIFTERSWRAEEFSYLFVVYYPQCLAWMLCIKSYFGEAIVNWELTDMGKNENS